MANSRLGLGWNQVPVEVERRRTPQPRRAILGVKEEASDAVTLRLRGRIPCSRRRSEACKSCALPAEASTASRAVPGIDIGKPSWWFALAQWPGYGCGAADRDPFQTQRNGCAASSKVAQMPTIEMTEPKGLGPRWIRSLLSCRVGIELGPANGEAEGSHPGPFGCEVAAHFHHRYVSRGPL
jgi:hypothetical protein